MLLIWKSICNSSVPAAYVYMCACRVCVHLNKWSQEVKGLDRLHQVCYSSSKNRMHLLVRIKKKRRAECSNNPWSPHLQYFFAVTPFTKPLGCFIPLSNRTVQVLAFSETFDLEWTSMSFILVSKCRAQSCLPSYPVSKKSVYEHPNASQLKSRSIEKLQK